MAKPSAKSTAKVPQEPLINRIPDRKKKGDNLSDTDKKRILEQTGLLQKVKKREAELALERVTTAEYIWQAVFLSIPFGFLLATFDVTVKVQYSEQWTYSEMILRALKSAPALFPFIFLSNRYKYKRFMQIIMAIVSAIAGSFLLYTLRHSPSLGQMLRAPGLATIWVYVIIQLDLIPAVATLALVGLYWFFGLKDK